MSDAQPPVFTSEDLAALKVEFERRLLIEPWDPERWSREMRLLHQKIRAGDFLCREIATPTTAEEKS